MINNAFKTRLVIKPEKWLIHSSLVELVVALQSNWWHHKYIIYILYKIKTNYKKFKIYVIKFF